MAKKDDDLLWATRRKFWGSFILFTRYFFPLITGREFILSNPIGRESHFITVARELTKVARCQQLDVLINIPPGSGKSTLLSMWVAWLLSRYPNCQFLYISYGHELAAKHTEFIKRILENKDYQDIFDVHIQHDSRAKDSFKTTAGGAVKAFGSSGPITGQDAGLPGCDHFTGAVIIDDAHKPDEVHSDTVRQRVISNYRETILQRPRGPNVPIIYIGQRLHEDDLAAYMMSGNDERTYKPIIIQALDGAGNALYPELNPLEQLLEKRDKNPYVFAGQYQQDPIPAGGALFKPHDFALLDEEPKMLATFITADTAETSQSYNDASVFSFWGIYKIEEGGIDIDQYSLHWINCWEERVEPKELEGLFRTFYAQCLTYPVKPLVAAIEKKSTGVTLLSTLQDMRGLKLREVARSKASGGKATRYLEMQPIIAAKLISLPKHGKHTQMCVDHMAKITANNTHRWDDICDTVYDAVKIALIDKNLYMEHVKEGHSKILDSLANAQKQRSRALHHSGRTHSGRR